MPTLNPSTTPSAAPSPGGTIVHSAVPHGAEARDVQVAVDLYRRIPCVVVTGLPGCAVRETADRVRSAIQCAGLEFPRKRVVVNLTPSDVRMVGTSLDLPIAVGILAADLRVDPTRLCDTGFYGELSLEGRVRPCRGVLAAVEAMRDTGMALAIVARESVHLAALVKGITVLAADTLDQVVDFLNGRGVLDAGLPLKYDGSGPHATTLDLSEVRGHARARRAMEIAAAGGHSLFLVGPPGCGKTMLATRLPTILPPMSRAESLETTRVWDVTGLCADGAGLVTRRPFRAPHHTISAAGMVGSPSLRPGEVSLAHNGILFLDEIPEFSRHVTALLKTPMEEGEVTLTRAAGEAVLPARVQVVAAANPCPCGYLGDTRRECRCTPDAVARYQERLDSDVTRNCDLTVYVDPISPDDIVRGEKGEDSATVRARVKAARAIQYRRQSVLNARAEVGDLRETFTSQALEKENDLVLRLNLHGPTYDAVIRVARTIADLDGSGTVTAAHVLEAASFRRTA